MSSKVSKAENRTLARAARAAITKSTLDITMLEIDCHDGTLELTGMVRPPRGHTGVMNVKKEFEIVKNLVRSVKGVRDVVDRVKLFES